MSNRMTSARAIVLEIIDQHDGHQTAQEIFEQAKSHLPSVNLSTIYRTLDYLVEKQRISISDMGLGTPVYESVSAHNHHHLVCQGCGKTILLENAPVEQFFQQVEQLKKFKINTNHLILFGVCEACQQNNLMTEKE
jgi:Fur family ferric uptake transcriptional regulator